jgi:beta-alanine--pyruvate transaminase
VRCFEAGLLVRTTGDTIALSPPLVLERAHVDRICETVAGVLDGID